MRLRVDVYREETGHAPVDPTDDSAWHFVAKDQHTDVVAAFRILGPEQRTFEFESQVDVSGFVPEGRSVALIGRLCIRADHRPITRSVYVHRGLMKLAIDFAREGGITDFVMYTFPHLLRFYRGVYFRDLDCTFLHPGYGQRMHLMHLDLVEFSKTPASRKLRDGR